MSHFMSPVKMLLVTEFWSYLESILGSFFLWLQVLVTIQPQSRLTGECDHHDC